ncbi:succinylglutamate desuccinylase [Halorientalis sp. IM1011]|uniref:succinylglutamate desuccinylase/aspartoacylase domain-containing protein n=1 Tax=Halorientalis sp. IM1011 TaxID=1932360 RepID=UPI00097CCF3D|nr:succinylglutamate desuccinylase/aspartoacylase family protein [Halorientalis sp. IM1011]AQL44042.1 succinylglutamate desuccinylase [Halorientalis sp. IM1011]
MRVETVGDGPAEIAVIGGIHGDEPCGVHAVETLLSADLEFQRPVKFVIANEKAQEQDVRYVDEDLNRAFPGNPDGDTHESRLAHELSMEVSDCQILALHSTQSYEGLFALVDEVREYERRICPRLSVDAVVETCDFKEGRLFEVTRRLIEVECGFQGSDTAAENAVQVTREFLAATGALPDDDAPHRDELPVYRLTNAVPKDSAEAYDVFATNFHEVPAGQPYAAADGREYVAETDFYPVLMSPYGYENVFGYAADRVGTLES